MATRNRVRNQKSIEQEFERYKSTLDMIRKLNASRLEDAYQSKADLYIQAWQVRRRRKYAAGRTPRGRVPGHKLDQIKEEWYANYASRW